MSSPSLLRPLVQAVLWACLIVLRLCAAEPPSPKSLEGSKSQSHPQNSAFWAFKPIAHPTPPSIAATEFRVRTGIDAFIFETLKASGLSPSPPATQLELIRRLKFDLTGLPPTPEEVRAFLEDTRADAYERWVDRFLESREFAEHWAQHWLDVVRYAESEGFEYDNPLPDAWRYRDYVIEAIDRDLPFNQFVLEQLAGDELPNPSPQQLGAAIFHRLGPVRRNAGNPEIALSRNEVLTERTDVIGAAFLGLTVGCARCHDHKIDPIPQKDYYRLQAYMASTQEHDVPLGPQEVQTAWETARRASDETLRKLRKEVATANAAKKLELQKQIEELEHSQPPRPPTIPTVWNDPKQRTEIHVLKRGDWERKGESVGPRPLSILVSDTVPEAAPDLPQPRTQLARWLTDPNNPLTARVIVNRLFQHHFGAGLVPTPNDFGKNGIPPSHPALLDWMANELLAHRWQLKPLHRMMVCSSVYRQSTRSSSMESALRKDPENRLLWRFNQRRLSAEEVRDSLLFVAGRLNSAHSGTSVYIPVETDQVQLLYKPDQWKVTPDDREHNRRSIYLTAKRNLRIPFLEVLDQPGLLDSCGRRESSIHAPQALELLNGRLTNELARSLAERLRGECGNDRRLWIHRGFWLVLNRPPTSVEIEKSMAFIDGQSLSEFSLALFNLNEFLYVQ